MRVVIDARIPDGLYGGVQQWVLGLASGLSRLPPADDEYLFLVGRGSEEWLAPYLSGPCRILRPRLRGRDRPHRGRLRRTVRRVVRPIRSAFTSPPPSWSPAARKHISLPPFLTATDGTVEDAKADVVHFPYQAGFLTAVPSLFQPHDLQHLHLPEFFSGEQRARREATYRAYCEQARLVVTPSRWVKADVATQYGINPDRIAVVNEPPVTDVYVEPTRTEIESISARLGLPERFIVYPAQTWPHKNHARLFEALRQLYDGGLTVPLVCTGHVNEMGAALLALAADLGIANGVRFLGYIAPVELKVVYERATALVFPSLYEGWGLPVVEAFKAGLPVACSNVTSLPEVVDGAALLFDPTDPRAIAAAIRRLWQDEALAEDLVRRGRAVAARLDWQRTALIMRAHYRQVAGLRLSDEDQALAAASA